MTSLKKVLRPAMLAALLVMTGVVGEVRADCDDDCPFDTNGYFTDCEQPDVGPATCIYSDGHYYANFGGC